MRKAIELFSMHPRSSLVLAVLTLCLGALFVSGWVPTSPNRRYFPGYEWVMASLCWAMSLFFAYCSRVGWRQSKHQDQQGL